MIMVMTTTTIMTTTTAPDDVTSGVATQKPFWPSSGRLRTTSTRRGAAAWGARCWGCTPAGGPRCSSNHGP